MSLTDSDERWLRLAILIRKTATEAVKDVLDKLLTLGKYGGTSFDERLRNALLLNESQLKKNNHLLNYQIPQVFPRIPLVFPGTYQDFDIGIVANLIKYFVGKTIWDADTKALPELSNLHSFDLTKLSPNALVKLLCEYRNSIFHHTGGRLISADDFNQLWDDFLRILDQLGYDIVKARDFRTGPLDRTAVQTLLEVIECVRGDTVGQELICRMNRIGALLLVLKEGMLANDAMKIMPGMREELKGVVAEEVTKMGAEVQQSKNEVVSEMGEKFAELKVSDTARHAEMCSGLSDIKDSIRELQTSKESETCAEKRIEDKMLSAQEACRRANQAILKQRELDLHGNQVEGKLKIDVMVPLLTVKCADADKARQHGKYEAECQIQSSLDHLNIEDFEGIFNEDERVLVRGVPGAGKSTLCHHILRQWIDGSLWSDRYDFVFHINSPELVHLLRKAPFTMEAALRALYPEVFKQIKFEDLKKWAIILDSIDEVDLEKICTVGHRPSVEDAVKEVIVSRERFDCIIVGRPHACERLRESLVKSYRYQYLEVLGFSTKHLIEYVLKSCPGAAFWRKISDNSFLLGMAHLPVFANIICHILAEDSTLQIETQTQMFVLAYAVFLTRHLKSTYVDKSTFKKLFRSEKLIEDLTLLSALAFTNLSAGKIYFASDDDYRISEIDSALITPFIIKREEWFSFSHATFMEFFAAIHLLINQIKPDEDLLGRKSLRGVMPLLFGLLGASARYSDSPEIVRNFVDPLLKKFKLKQVEYHPLCGKLSESAYKFDVHFYLALLFEFQNSKLLEIKEIFWDTHQALPFFSHQEFNHMLFFMKYCLRGERGIGGLHLIFPDLRMSVVECSDLHHSIALDRCKLNLLSFLNCYLNEETTPIFAPLLCLIPEVYFQGFIASDIEVERKWWKVFLSFVQKAIQSKTLRLSTIYLSHLRMNKLTMNFLVQLLCLLPNVELSKIHLESVECWEALLCSVKDAQKCKTLRLEELTLSEFTASKEMMSTLAPALCLMSKVKLANLHGMNPQCWEVFLSSVRAAQEANTCKLETLVLVDISVDSNEAEYLAQLLCLIPNVEISIHSSEFWKGFRGSVQQAKQSQTLKLKALTLEKVELNEQFIGYLCPLVCLISELSLDDIQATSPDFWKMFLHSVQDAQKNQALFLKTLRLENVEVGGPMINFFSQVVCLMSKVRLINTELHCWEVFLNSVKDAEKSQTLLLETLNLENFEMSEPMISFLAALVCFISTVQFTNIRTMNPECWKVFLSSVRGAQENKTCKLKTLMLGDIAFGSNETEYFAQLLCLIPNVLLGRNSMPSSESWEVFLHSVQNVQKSQMLRLKLLMFRNFEMNEQLIIFLAPLACFISAVCFESIHGMNPKCWKVFLSSVRGAQEDKTCKLETLVLHDISVAVNETKYLAQVLCLIPNVALSINSTELWRGFLGSVQQAKQSKTLKLKTLTLEKVEFNEQFIGYLCPLVCFISTVQFTNIRTMNPECWKVFLSSVRGAQEDKTCKLETLILNDISVGSNETEYFAQLLCLIPIVLLYQNFMPSRESWQVFLHSVQNAAKGQTLKLKTLALENAEISDQSISFLAPLVCLVSPAQLTNIHAMSPHFWKVFLSSVRGAQKGNTCKLETLILNDISVKANEAKQLAQLLCLMPNVVLYQNSINSSEFWKGFLGSVQEAKKSQTLKLKTLTLEKVELNEQFIGYLCPLVCLIPELRLDYIQPSSSDFWKVFLHSVQDAQKNQALHLKTLRLENVEVGGPMITFFSQVVCLMWTVQLVNSELYCWEVLLNSVKGAEMSRTLLLKTMVLENFEMNEQIISFLTALVCFISTVQFSNIRAMTAECWKVFLSSVRGAQKGNTCKLETLILNDISVRVNETKQLAQLLCLIPKVELSIHSSEFWKGFLGPVQEAKLSQTLKLKVLSLRKVEFNEQFIGYLCPLVCLISELWLGDIQATSPDFWKVFLHSVQDAQANQALHLKTLKLKNVKVGEPMTNFFSQVVCLILKVQLLNTELYCWDVFLNSVKDAEKTQTLLLKTLNLENFELSEPMISFLAALVCFISTVQFTNIRAMTAECWKVFLSSVRDAQKGNTCKLETLILNDISVKANEAKQLAQLLCLMPNVVLYQNSINSSEFWKGFLGSVQEAKQSQTLKLKTLTLEKVELNEQFIGYLCPLVCLIPELSLDDIQATSPDFWKVFLHSVHDAQKNQALQLKTLRLENVEVGGPMITFFSQVVCLILKVQLLNTELYCWDVFLNSVKDAEKTQTLLLKTLNLENFELSEPMISFLAALVCFISTVQFTNIRAMTAECWKVFLSSVRDAQKGNTCKLETLILNDISVKANEAKQLAQLLCLMPNVVLYQNSINSSEFWKGFLGSVQEAKQSQTLKLKTLTLEKVELNEQFIGYLCPLVCLIPELSLDDIQATSPDFWKVFLHSVHDAQKNQALQLKTLRLENVEVGGPMITFFSQVVCLILEVQLVNTELYCWEVLLNSVEGAEKSRTLLLKTMVLENFEMSEPMISFLTALVCFISTVQFTNIRAMNPECWKVFLSSVRGAQEDKTCKLETLILNDISVGSNKTEYFAQLLCLIPIVLLYQNCMPSRESWQVFLHSVQNAANGQTLKLKTLALENFEMNEQMISFLTALVCFISTFQITNIRTMSPECWKVFLSSVRGAQEDETCKLETLILRDISVGVIESKHFAQLLCLIPSVLLYRISMPSIDSWEVFLDAVRNAKKSRTLKLKTLKLDSVDVNDEMIVFLGPLVCMISEFQLANTPAMSSKCWEVFLGSVQAAEKSQTLQLKTVKLKNVNGSEEMIGYHDSFVCLLSDL